MIIVFAPSTVIGLATPGPLGFGKGNDREEDSTTMMRERNSKGHPINEGEKDSFAPYLCIGAAR
jgi:hypothetical protein